MTTASEIHTNVGVKLVEACNILDNCFYSLYTEQVYDDRITPKTRQLMILKLAQQIIEFLKIELKQYGDVDADWIKELG